MRRIVLMLGLVGCGAAPIDDAELTGDPPTETDLPEGPPAARVGSGAYTLVGARTSTSQTMEAWSGAPVTLAVAAGAVTLTVDGVATELAATAWPAESWEPGCWSMGGTVPQEVWGLACDAGVDLGGGMAAACPLALIATCPDGRTLFVRDVPNGDDGGTGCGISEVCFQFEPAAD